MITDRNIDEYTGPDIDIDTSLFEYGLGWKEIPMETFFYGDVPKKKYEFIYGIGYDDNANYNKFDSATMDYFEFIELINDGWIDLNSVLSSIGISEAEFMGNFPNSVGDLISYYGYEEIFGTSYWEGFEIKKGEDDDTV